MAETSYLDFDLSIQKQGEDYLAKVVRSPAGASSAVFVLPPAALELNRVLAEYGGYSASPDAIEELGQSLFDQVMMDDLRVCLADSLTAARRLGAGLRVRLNLHKAPDLMAIPWEYLRTAELGGFLSLLPDVSLMRTLAFPLVVPSRQILPPLRVLVLINQPTNLGPLKVEDEWKSLVEKLDTLAEWGLASVERLDNPTRTTLPARLSATEFHILHFIGHAGYEFQSQQGMLALTNQENQEADWITSNEFAEIVRQHHPPRVVVLNASFGAQTSSKLPFGGIAQAVMQKGIPVVVAMQIGISDTASLRFTGGFYGALVNGNSVDVAVSQGRRAVFDASKGSLEWGVPVIYSQTGDDYLLQPDLTEAQIDRNWQVLAQCTDITTSSKAHLDMSVRGLSGTSYTFLRDFASISHDTEVALAQNGQYNQRLALSNIERRIDNLVRDLSTDTGRYALRLRPVAEFWRKLIINHVEYLLSTARVQEEIDDPYVIGVPLTNQQEVFVGRTNIGARIEQFLLDRRRPPLLLYGQRRTGKTSLLNNLGRLLPSSTIPLFVDLQGPATQASDHAGFLYNLARGMVDSAQRERGLILPSLARESLTADSFTRFDEWLNEVETALGRCTALLSLDEFEALDRALTQGRFSDTDVLGMLRNLIQHRPRFKVLLAGSHTLEELERWAGYLINVQVVHISYLKEDEARKLVEQPVVDFALRYDPDASQRVLELTRCHPYLVQLLCGEIVALKNEQEVAVRRLARLADVEVAASEALSHGSLFFADIERNQVDADGLALLRPLAAQGERTVMSREQLAAQIVDPTRLGRSLASLIQRELIEPADGGYRFQVELIRRWFAQERGR